MLRAISVLYAGIIKLRNIGYDKGWLRSISAKAPVISIGNITTGGTGKTPLVIWMCDLLRQKELKCSVLTRGYKSEKGKLTDEPALLAKACPNANIVVNSDRVAGAEKGVAEFKAKVLIMDDGFQHRRLQRDLDIVAIDATCPFGYGNILPAGLLREPVKSLKRAHAVIITRYDQVTDEGLVKLEESIKSISPGITIAKAVHRHTFAKAMKGVTYSFDELKKHSIFAYCGIGNPNAFLHRLEEYGFDVVGWRVYNDHHDYTEKDLDDIYEEARYLGADMVLSTHKDWVKTALLSKNQSDLTFAYLVMELEFIEGEDEIKNLISKTIDQWTVDRL
jgi:tetraacyldisaccharide 4'-kinase